MWMTGMPIHTGQYAGFIAMLGVTIIAAPGVPGGAIMAALGRCSRCSASMKRFRD